MSVILKTTGSNQRDIPNGQIVTKLYDLGDVSLVKKFSSCLITYRMWGGGVSPLKVMYRIDERGSFKNFNVKPENVHSAYDNGARLCRTGNRFKTAEFEFDNAKKKGQRVQIKIQYNTNMESNSGTEIERFELSDVTFTYRPINRE